MRDFLVSENESGLYTWGIAECINGRFVPVADVSVWHAEGVKVDATRIGWIAIHGASMEIEGNEATFRSQHD